MAVRVTVSDESTDPDPSGPCLSGDPIATVPVYGFQGGPSAPPRWSVGGCDTRDCTPFADDDGRALGLLAVVGNAPSMTLGAQASAWMDDDVHHDVGTIAIVGSGRGETHIAEAVELRAAHSVTPSFSGWPDAYGVAPASDAGGDCRASRPRPGAIRVAPRALLRLFRRRRRRRLEVVRPRVTPGEWPRGGPRVWERRPGPSRATRPRGRPARPHD